MYITYQLILEDKILAKAFKYIVDNNRSTYAPYHHFHHMMCVTKWCIDGAKYHNIKHGSTPWYELVLSAMFHDMNHSMGKFSDEDNVDNATYEFHSFYKKFLEDSGVISSEKVCNIIRATQYPYVIEDCDLSISQQIIRDADLLISLEPDFMQNAFLGLKKEMGVSEMISMIDGQEKFHRSIKMRTEWAKEIYENQWESKVFKTINLLKKLYED